MVTSNPDDNLEEAVNDEDAAIWWSYGVFLLEITTGLTMAL